MKDPIFKANPEADCYFETADGQKFFKDTDAKNHARTLEVKKIKKVLNPDYATEVSEIEEVVAGTEAGQDLTAEETANAEALNVEFTEVKTGEATGSEMTGKEVKVDEVGTLEVSANEATQEATKTPAKVVAKKATSTPAKSTKPVTK